MIALTVIMFLHGALTANAAPEESATTDVEINGLHIKAGRMVYGGDGHSYTLSRGVEITQGSTVITADNVKVFTKSNPADTEQMVNGNSLEKIVAKGDVRIELDDGVATSEKATYNAETKIIVLSGSGTKFVNDSGTISGSGDVIKVNRNTGDVTVDSADAVIFSDGEL